MSTPEKDLSVLEHDIEATRERLAGNLDQLLHRASPKTIVRREVTSVRQYFVDESGAPRTDHVLKVVGGVVGFVALLVVVRRVTS